jgi:hypothetical protein
MNNSWSPRNASTDSAGLHLYIKPDNLGGGRRYTAGEVVLLENADGSPAHVGYGTYLVSAQIKTASS